MFRKDVRIGLAIGGVLIAVLFVYLLITAAPHKNPEVTLAPDPTAEPSASTDKAAPAESSADDPFAAQAQQTNALSQPANPTTAPQDDRWLRALTTGTVGDAPPLLLTETPAPARQGAADESSPTPPGTAPVSASRVPGSAIAGSSPPTAVNPVATAPRTHVVQRGESFSSIAQAAYGNSAYYPHLMRANPNIDPKKLRPGMTIVIPDASEVVATASSDAKPVVDSKPTTPIDDRREYRVQSGDSLYKIALKLYGRADRADAIYELNKDAIGPNRSYLQVGMTLKLPDPPTSTTAAR